MFSRIQIPYNLETSNEENRQRNEKGNEETILIKVVLCRKRFPIPSSIVTFRIHLPSKGVDSLSTKYYGRVY